MAPKPGRPAPWEQYRRPRAQAGATVPLHPGADVSALPRIRPAEVKALHRLGLRTVRDVLLDLPYDLDAYGDPTPIAALEAGAHATVVGTVVSVYAKRARYRSLNMTEATIQDDDGSPLKVVWFNQPYIAQRLHRGDRVALAGPVRAPRYGRILEMSNPHHELVAAEGGPQRVGGFMPKYHLSAGLTQRRRADWAEAALKVVDELADEIPEPTRGRHGLLPLVDAVRRGHRPDSWADWDAACQRMAFAELLELQAAFLMARRRIAIERATPIPYQQDVIDTFKAGLPFELTHAQRRATWDVFQDLREHVPMNRLLNGDVGSGKTAVAAAAAAMAHAAGLQTMVMAPTEILARQHLEKFRAYLETSFPGLTVELLVSGLGAAERRRVRTAAASGHCALLVGTHALIEEDVELAALGLAVVDEQHRFGTRQRELLREKSAGRPHFLAMTATPIPRTLALAMYGEMALSIIDELPPGRTPIETTVMGPDERSVAADLVRQQVREGRQAFVICPLIEESEQAPARAATVEYERLRRDVFPDLRVSLVHGRMKDKDAVMRAFRAGESDVLVATSVVEVGVDVPNATVMLIEGADRFGLAQLHQLRGRVGRGASRSYCVLLADEPSGSTLQRLELVARTTDGFRLANEDMRNRGIGELMGPRQHGVSDVAMRALSRPELLSEVRQEVEALAAEDPGLDRWPDLWAAAERRLEQTSIS